MSPESRRSTPPERRRLSPRSLPEPQRVLSWMYLGRISLAVAIFLAVAVGWRATPAETTLAVTLILVATVGFTGASAWHTHVAAHPPGRGFLYAQAVYDVLMVAAVVHLTGGKDSDFAALFVLVIVAAGVLLPFLGGILIGALASILYFADVVWSAHELDLGVLLQIALFAIVALVTGYVGDRLRHTGTVLGEVETELRQLRLDTDDILGGIATGVLTVDAAGRLAYLNRAATELLGVEPHHWLGRQVLEQLDRVAPGLGAVIARTLETRVATKRFETRETPGGLVFGVSTTVLLRGEEGPPGVTAIFQDITERKRVDALRRRAERLGAVAELSASLAHEIKNPLASIRSAVEQLTGNGVDAEDRVVLQELVVRESDRLSRLLTDFIDFARVKVRAPEPLRVETLARHAVEVARAHPHAEDRAVELALGPGAAGAVVSGDGDLLHRAVLNLVLNALQWAGPGGRVEVAVERVEAEILSAALAATEAVRIRVSDTGPGVPSDAVEHVFDPFFTLRPGGTGLGLSMVQRAAEAHGGAVFVDEPRGDGWGATFTLYLPALAGDAPGRGATRGKDET